MRTVGIISDTHKLLRPEVLSIFSHVDHIVHAGDIGKEQVIQELAKIAPVIAIRGNVDRDSWADAYADELQFELYGKRFLVIHNRNELQLDLSQQIDVVISGHSHKPLVESTAAALFINPGSAGPRRFKLPVAVALLHIAGDRMDAEIVPIQLEP